ncbi:hypothetical protein AY599_16140 [Leptolyngbya valderiana BDU 20041]|nr:hypothetical protein AY599_16140 [Leptolyngbya valderiana BDU 20041]
MRDAPGAPPLDSMASLWKRPRPRPEEPREDFLPEDFLEVFVVSVSVESALEVDPLSEVLGFRAMMWTLSCRECRAARHRHAAGDATPMGGGRACERGSGGHFGVLRNV